MSRRRRRAPTVWLAAAGVTLAAAVASLPAGQTYAAWSDYVAVPVHVGAGVWLGPGDPPLPAQCRGIVFDRIIIGTNRDDTLVGTAGNDLIFGGNQTDEIKGLGGDDCLVAGNGKDWTKSHGDKDDNEDECDAGLLGGAGDDVLVGGNGKDLLDGGPGTDSLYGENGADDLYGGPGNDQLYGGDGPDDLYGGSGQDLLDQGKGKGVMKQGGPDAAPMRPSVGVFRSLTPQPLEQVAAPPPDSPPAAEAQQGDTPAVLPPANELAETPQGATPVVVDATPVVVDQATTADAGNAPSDGATSGEGATP